MAHTYYVIYQGDPSPTVRGQAYRQVLIENEKHPEFLPARLLDGVCLCYTFQHAALGANNVSAILASATITGGAASSAGEGSTMIAQRQCIFGPMYASCIRTNRKHRYSFLRNMLSLFEEKTARDVHNKALRQREDVVAAGKRKKHKQQQQQQQHGLSAAARRTSSGVPLSTAATAQKGSLDPAFLAFIAQVLAYLPFDVQEEPLFLVYHISRIVSLDGSTLLSELKRLFAKAGVKGGGGEEESQSSQHDQQQQHHGDSDSDVEEEEEKDGHRHQQTAAGGGDGMEMGGEEECHLTGNGVNRVSPALLAELKDKCAAGMAFCMLLHLKFFLKQVCVT